MKQELSLESITRDDWQTCEDCPGWTPFHGWDWLSWFAPLVDCQFVPLALLRNGHLVGLAPMLLRRQSLGYTANLVPFPFLGPIVPPELLSETARLLRRWGLRHRVARMQLTVYPAGQLLSGSLDAAGFDEQPIETFAIDLRRPTDEDTFSSFTKDVRNAWRRSQKRGVSIRASTPEDLTSLLPKIHREVLGDLTPYTVNIGIGLAQGGLPIPVHTTTAYLNEKPIGMQVAIGGATTMGWLIGVVPEARDSQASTALIWDLVQWARQQQFCWLDLGSAPTAGNAAFSASSILQFWQAFVGIGSCPDLKRCGAPFVARSQG